ncbi:16108_t:CDS:1, partial [Dentiscutata erythropus]
MQHIKTNTALVAIARQTARNLLGAKSSSTVIGHHATSGFSNRGAKTSTNMSRRHYSNTNGASTSSLPQTNQTEIFNGGISGSTDPGIQQRPLDLRQEQLYIREYNDLLMLLKQRGLPREVERRFEEMKRSGVQPTTFTYNLILDTVAGFRNENNNLDKLIQYYDEMIRDNVKPNLSTYNIMIKTLCKRDFEIQTKLYRLKKRANTGGNIRAIQTLEKENCIDLAFQLFKKSIDVHGYYYEVDLCDVLLRSLAPYGRIEEGLTVFEYMEKRGIVSPYTFGYLISMYSHVGDMESALECFKEYKKVSPNLSGKHEPMAVYNQMISAYVRCDNVKGAIEILEKDAPENGLVPDEWSYFYLIRDLCDTNKTETAQEWFDKMKIDESLPKPFNLIYDTMLMQYSLIGDYSNSTKVYQEMKDINLCPRYSEMSLYLHLTLKHDPDRILDLLDDMYKGHLVTDLNLTRNIMNHFVQEQQPEKALTALIKIKALTDHYTNSSSNRSNSPLISLDDHIITLLNYPYLSLKGAIDAKFQLLDYGYNKIPNFNKAIFTKYDTVKANGEIVASFKELDSQHIFALFDNATSLYNLHIAKDDFNTRVFELVEDLKLCEITLPYRTFTKVHHHYMEAGDLAGADKWKEIASVVLTTKDSTKESSQKSLRQPTIEEINRSSEISQLCKTHAIDSALLLSEFHKMLKEDLIPTPELVSQAIRNLGKSKNLKEAEELYKLSLEFFPKLDPSVSTNGLNWARNSMLIAYASNGQLDKAYQIYNEIFALGYQPDANAYADLLVAESDRDPDEAATAIKLYDEIKRYNIKPTLYFYNVLISKLGKARKYDAVWEAFKDMKRRRIQPNSITYGALITACTRVKSEDKALMALREMENSKSFQPRIGPYNTLMQFYTWDLRDREKALKYFGEINRHNLKPSDHTYKLLIDAYSTIEPFDMKSALNVFEQMKRDGVTPQPTHYASLIYAYGCCHRAVQNSLQTFNTMQSMFNIRPDQSVYQALFDALIANDRIAEAEEYYDVMLMQGDVKSTPYIENLFIRGYGQLGQWERAETVFNNMIDADDLVSEGVPREPSTYEEMVKAYVISGQIEKAKEVANILEHKNFPEI